jgi:kynurenine formamidase
MIPLSGELVDLSVPLGPSPSEHVPVLVERFTHADGGEHLAQFTGIDRRHLAGGLGWASERISAITHSGTHVDAPFHYAPTSGGRRCRTIDEVPLRWFLGQGVCVDVTQGEDAVSIAEVQSFASRNDLDIGCGDIVLFRTGATYGGGNYNEHGRGLSPELVTHLCRRGVRIIGTDAWSIDFPFDTMRRRGTPHIWEAHFAGRECEFCAIEKLTNLDRLPPSGFFVICLPVKVDRGSAGWTRAVAVLP